MEDFCPLCERRGSSTVWTTEGEFLFRGGWLNDYLQGRTAHIRAHVEQLSNAEFGVAADDVLVARVLSAVRVDPLVLDRDNIEMATDDVTLDASRDPNRAAFHFAEGPVPLPATRFTLSIPFTGLTEL